LNGHKTFHATFDTSGSDVNHTVEADMLRPQLRDFAAHTLGRMPAKRAERELGHNSAIPKRLDMRHEACRLLRRDRDGRSRVVPDAMMRRFFQRGLAAIRSFDRQT